MLIKYNYMYYANFDFGGKFKEISNIVPDSKKSDTMKAISSEAGTLSGEKLCIKNLIRLIKSLILMELELQMVPDLDAVN